MDIKTMIMILVPCVCSFLISLASIVLSVYRDWKKKSDLIWETASEILLRTGGLENRYPDKNDAEETVMYFNYLYKLLGAVKSDTFEAVLKERREKQL